MSTYIKPLPCIGLEEPAKDRNETWSAPKFQLKLMDFTYKNGVPKSGSAFR